MEKLYKLLGGLAIKWKTNFVNDEFFIARIRLTFYYSITAIIILGGSSVLLYNMVLSNLSQSLSENIFLSPDVSQTILDNAQDILLNRFLTIDGIIVIFIIILGFLLTHKTLKPIKSNMLRQKRFIADASHELRTPTAVIISGLEVNLNNKKLDFPSAKKALENTLGEMREFSQLSNALLDISKYDAEIETKKELIQINELVKNVVEKNISLGKIKELMVEEKIESPAIVLGNKIELTRVFFNILDNAIKYSKQGGKITIHDKTTAGKYVLTVSDTGVGVEASILDKVFDPFFRGDASHGTDGAGLGLTLSKKIIEGHKGTISIKSQINQGTTVVITLPVASR